MANYTSIEARVVAVGANVLFDNINAKCNTCHVKHRDGSGIFTLKGGHEYEVLFSANITGATADVEVGLQLALSGEGLGETLMLYTPAAAGDFGNVATHTTICVPPCCCYTLSVENADATAVTVQNASLSIREV